MKKLCTYLTLFVLGLLALAQPVVAADLVKGQKYYIDASGFTGSLGTIKIWAGTGEGVTTDITATTVADKIYSWTQPADQTGFTLWVKNDNSEFAFGSSAIGNNNCIKITGSTWNSAAAQWTTYTPGGGGDSTDYTFYLNPGTVAWSDVYVYLFGSSDSKWDNVYQHYSTKLSNGYYKFEVKGVTKAGNMLFKSNNTDTWLGDKTDQSRDIEGTNVKNGALYTLGEMYIDNNNKKGYNYTVTEDYQEPGGHVVINIRGQFIDGDHEGKWGIPDYNRTMDWNESRGIYTYEATDVATKGGKFMVSSVAGDKFWDGRYESVSGGTLTIPSVQPDAANIKKGGGIDFTLPAAGTICFDLDALKIWYEPATTQKPVLTANPAGGEFETSVSVTLSATPACDIYYTTNGTEPSAASSKYSSPLSFTATTTLKAVAILNGESSDVITYTYTKKEEGVYSGSLYAKGPACNNDWKTWAQLSGTDGVFSFDIIAQGEFLVCGSTNDNDIYCIDGSVTYPFVIPQGEAAAAKIKKKEGAIPGNFKAPAANGKIFIDMNDHKIWYEPKSYSNTDLYIRAAFISDNDWGKPEWNKEMTWNESEGVYVWDATSAKTGDQFMISWNMDMWNHKFACDPIPTEKPSTSNVNDDNSNNGSDLKLPKPGYIKYDPVNKILWVAPEQAVLPTLYTFYVKIDDVYASQWGDDTCYLYTFDEGDDKWTSINGQCVKYDRRLADGVYKFVVRGQTSKGRMLFKNTAAVSDMQEYSGTILPADIRPRALYTISAKGEVSVAPEDYVETNVFEAGKAYYVDASAVAKDGTNWFENADCTLGVEYDGHVHFGGTIVKVSSDPLVYRFTVDEDQTEIVVGRRNNQGLHNPVTVKAPTDGSNCIFLDGSTGVLKLDHFGTYSPAGGLYILGSSNAIDGDWKSATPIAMNYDEAEGVYYYMVQGTNASADNPIEFLISRGATNSAFFNAANAFEPVRDGYIHMAEPSYMKGKPGYTDGNYFKLISRGRVMAKYIKAENSEEITGLKIWYEPVVWPDLYILGSIIADPDDTKDIQSTNEQWHTFQKLVKDDKQPGLYYYDLGRNGNEHLFNEKPYPVTGGVFGDIDEHGHFNFSFLSGTDTGVFWKDAFVPAVGQGMGTLNRDGVPVPFQYRDSKPDQTEWVSTNFVFGERSRIWVDVVRQLVWIETFTELSGNQVVFDFWDKGGTAYSKEDGYQWWSATDAATHSIQSYLVDADGIIVDNADSPYTLKASDLNWQALEVIDNVGSGVRYHFVAELPASYYEKGADDKPTDKVANGYHVWIRIKDNANADHEILRPYAYQATYTQGPKEDIAYNHYGNILYAGEPLVDMVPSVKMIPSDVEAPKHLGSTRSTQVMHYPYVNQFTTAITVNADGYPFYVDGVTEPYKHADGSPITAEEIANGYKFVDGDVFKPVDGAPVFSKRNQATLHYGEIVETQSGTTGLGYMTGVDHANADPVNDYLEVVVTYTSEGLNFSRTKKQMLFDETAAYDLLPTMSNTKESSDHTMGIYSFLGSSCEKGGDYTLDLLFDQSFNFRDEMTGGDNPRAAYVGYKINIDEAVKNDSHVSDGNKHLAVTGAPLVWDFTDGKGTNIAAYDQDKWHYQAFLKKRLVVQLHHVLCAKTKEDLSGNITGNIEFHLFVPVATEFKFEGGTTGEAEAQAVKGMFRAPAYTKENPYRGPISADSYDSFAREINFNANAGNITTGVEGVGVEDAPVEFYNLQGVRMTSETLAPGIYIRRQGNETSKVYIR